MMLKTEAPRDKALPASQYLAAVVLDSGHVAFEFQQTQEAVSAGRRELEKYLYEIYEQDPARALLALGLTEPSFGFSPSMEFWRGFSALFVHALLVAPETEKRRGQMRVELAQEEAEDLISRVPPWLRISAHASNRWLKRRRERPDDSCFRPDENGRAQ